MNAAFIKSYEMKESDNNHSFELIGICFCKSGRIIATDVGENKSWIWIFE